VTVTLGLAKDVEGALQVDVADTGIGIAPDDIARILTVSIVDSPAVQEVGGSGLGLVDCQDVRGDAGWQNLGRERARQRIYLLLHAARSDG